MRSTRARQAALLLGVGLGAFFEGILMHPLAGFLYWLAWALTFGGVLVLWSAVRGPGPLPSGHVFIGHFILGWGAFSMLEGLARHDLAHEWLGLGPRPGLAPPRPVLLRPYAQATNQRR